ncbi:hypothetical protein F4553_002637 [Allocatelliglobosispora scoriae]|uniref:Uncharacterized protein n=1 Tax=Allocatelliglobosispora scoriae TaxID=643052 RepID=A0A841BPF4_9ACTN|nr:hypothetical protein [Allocatelliglobosispora scoriae]MBB5869258.1 hypothetical protein [Allocatelliglobosispora scoriae]
MRYIRFQSPEVDDRGRNVGVFGLVNGLAKQGRLIEEQERFRRLNNDWYDAAYPDPATVDATVYDRELHPGAAAWFKVSAQHLVERVDGYLEILTAHGVACVVLRSDDPGRVIYEDDHQIVVVPVADLE